MAESGRKTSGRFGADRGASHPRPLSRSSINEVSSRGVAIACGSGSGRTFIARRTHVAFSKSRRGLESYGHGRSTDRPGSGRGSFAVLLPQMKIPPSDQPQNFHHGRSRLPCSALLTAPLPGGSGNSASPPWRAGTSFAKSDRWTKWPSQTRAAPIASLVVSRQSDVRAESDRIIRLTIRSEDTVQERLHVGLGCLRGRRTQGGKRVAMH